jgi:hypothetical protein
MAWQPSIYREPLVLPPLINNERENAAKLTGHFSVLSFYPWLIAECRFDRVWLLLQPPGLMLQVLYQVRFSFCLSC